MSWPVGKTGIVRLPELLNFYSLPPRLVATIERIANLHGNSLTITTHKR